MHLVVLLDLNTNIAFEKTESRSAVDGLPWILRGLACWFQGQNQSGVILIYEAIFVLTFVRAVLYHVTVLHQQQYSPTR